MPCSAGTYRSTDQTECIPCEEGKVSTETGATSCTSCDPGKQANSDKTQCGKCLYPSENRITKSRINVKIFLKEMCRFKIT